MKKVTTVLEFDFNEFAALSEMADRAISDNKGPKTKRYLESICRDVIEETEEPRRVLTRARYVKNLQGQYGEG